MYSCLYFFPKYGSWLRWGRGSKVPMLIICKATWKSFTFSTSKQAHLQVNYINILPHNFIAKMQTRKTNPWVQCYPRFTLKFWQILKYSLHQPNNTNTLQPLPLLQFPHATFTHIRLYKLTKHHSQTTTTSSITTFHHDQQGSAQNKHNSYNRKTTPTENREILVFVCF